MTMSTEMYSHHALPTEVMHSAGNEIVMDFDNVLDICIKEFSSSRYTVVLPVNLQERYGNVLFAFFQHTLARQVGEAVNLTCITDNNGSKTFVQMRQVNLPHQGADQQRIAAPQAATPDEGVNTVGTVVEGEKVPRPMNCWLHFRAEWAPKFAKQNPSLSIQRASKLCSDIWKTYPEEKKAKYRRQAAAGAALHRQMNPNYRYQPRKSGEKKKRVSRRAREAAAAAAAEAEAFDITQTPAMINTEVTAADPSNNDFNNGFAYHLAQVVDSTGVLDLQQQDLDYHDQLYDTESLRHDRLLAEFDSSSDTNMPCDQFGEDAFAFRTGADSNATLPSIYSDHY